MPNNTYTHATPWIWQSLKLFDGDLLSPLLLLSRATQPGSWCFDLWCCTLWCSTIWRLSSFIAYHQCRFLPCGTQLIELSLNYVKYSSRGVKCASIMPLVAGCSEPCDGVICNDGCGSVYGRLQDIKVKNCIFVHENIIRTITFIRYGLS